MARIVPIIVFAAELDPRGERLKENSIVRLKEGVREYLNLKRQNKRGVFFLSAGFNRKWYPLQKDSFAHIMRSYLSNRWVREEDLVYGRLGWGTRHEIRAALEKILMLASKGGSIERIVLCSDYYHLRRIRFIAWSELRRARLEGVPVRFVETRVASTKLSPFGVLWEFLAWCRILLETPLVLLTRPV